MSAVPVQPWRDLLRRIDKVVAEASWDFVVYCRFLADRLPETGTLSAVEFASQAEELMSDLKEGVDRRAQKTFEPPLVSGRSDLLYNYFRENLAIAAKEVGGESYAKEVAAALKPVLPAPTPKTPPAEAPGTAASTATDTPAKAAPAAVPATPAE